MDRPRKTLQSLGALPERPAKDDRPISEAERELIKIIARCAAREFIEERERKLRDEEAK